ncbi:selenium metabolism-associated LysR family transcriptional regulator [Adlercreutzia sp. ZJ141]|uniref:selenium metabolism-associated LysR family transcriptional regulator n=1 Tax=Adlercreutzia sp. ZJ141 TaxID=2709406 RepID=UPI0013EDD0A3|nr:selenium metabolism-associated LysR family transcriptional regulator [Adlercreutzia sp. ZJ141]
MELNQMRSFVCVVDEQSFSEAARTLHVSQPTISTHISSLEKACDAALIVRTTKRFEVTPAGWRFYEYAQRMLDLERSALHVASEQAGLEVTVGASSVPGRSLLPGALSCFRSEYPGVRCRVSLASSLDVINGVADGTYDIGLVGTRKTGRVSYLPLRADELVVIAPDTPQYRKLLDEGTHGEFLSQPFVVRGRSSGTRIELQMFLERFGVSLLDLNVVAEMDDTEMICRCVSAGVGIAVVSKLALEGLSCQGTFIVRSFRDEPLCRRLYLAYLGSRYQPSTLKRLVELICEQACE